MGWFRGQTYIRCPHHEFFVPEWGWVGSKNQSICQIKLHFRPRVGMGWFKRVIMFILFKSDFRPRLGMGWFSIKGVKNHKKLLFSSPLGVGLVLDWNERIFQLHNFRPRVGMGWFKITPETLTDNFRFSSPSEDGLVRVK